MAGHLCGECENSVEEDGGFCLECTDYLCERCTFYHRRNKASRLHRIILGNDVPDTASAFAELNTITTCSIHEGQTLSSFCPAHGEYVCIVCVADAHRTCDTTGIVEMAQSSGLDKILINIADMQTNLDKSENDAVAFIKRFANDRECMHTRRQASYSQQLKELNRKNEEIKTEIDKLFNEHVGILEKRNRRSAELSMELSEMSAVVDICTKHFTEERNKLYLVENRARRVLASVNETYQEQKNTPIQTIEWIAQDSMLFGRVVTKTVTAEQLRGKINKTEQDKSPDQVHGVMVQGIRIDNGVDTSSEALKTTASNAEEIPADEQMKDELSHTKSMPDEDNASKPRTSVDNTSMVHTSTWQTKDTRPLCKSIRVPSDNTTCRPIRCMITRYNRYLILDDANRALKMFDANFKFLAARKIAGRPQDACLLDEDRLAFVCQNERDIYKSEIKTDSIAEVKNCFKLKAVTLGLAYMGGDRLGVLVTNKITEENRDIYIDIRTTIGQSVKIIYLVTDGVPVTEINVVNPISLNCLQNEFLVGGLERLSRITEGEVCKWYAKNVPGKPLKNVTDVSTFQNTLYVCGNASGNIQSVAVDDFWKRELFVSRLERPRSVCVNKKAKCLVVGFDDNDEVTIYTL